MFQLKITHHIKSQEDSKFNEKGKLIKANTKMTKC